MILWLLLFTLNILQGQTSYKVLIERLNNNIDAKRIERNLELAHTADFKKALEGFTCVEQGKINHLMGLSYYLLYKEANAVEYFERAVFDNWKDCREVEEKDVANTMFNIGICYQYSTEIHKGKYYLDTALMIMEHVENYPKEDLASKYEGAGYYYLELNNYSRAENLLRQAANLEEYVDSYTLMNIRLNQLILYNTYAKYDEAESIFLRVDSLYHQNFQEYDNELRVLYFLNTAAVCLHLNRFDESEQRIQEAFKYISNEDVGLRSDAKEILGNICVKREKYKEARRWFTESYAFRKKHNLRVQDKLAESISLHNLSEVEYFLGNYDNAIELINESINIISSKLKKDASNNPILEDERINFPISFVRHLQLKELILSKQNNKDDLTERLDLLYKIDTIIYRSMQNLSFENSKLELLVIIQTQTDEALDVCKQLYDYTNNSDYLSKAFYFSSQAKSYILQQVIQEKRFFDTKADPKVLDEITTARNRIAAIQNQLLVTESDSLLQLLVGRELELEKLLSNFTNAVQSSFWDNKMDFTIEQIQAKMPKSYVLLDIFEGQDQVFFTWIVKDKVLLETMKTKDVLVDIDSLNYYNRNPSVHYDRQYAQDLYRKIFTDQVQEMLPQNYRLKIIPEGNFFNLNVETLIDKQGEFLFTHTPISYCYHPAFLFSNRGYNSKKRFLGFGTGYTDELDQQLRRKKFMSANQSLGKLNNSEHEIIACNRFMKGRTFLGREASLTNFKKHAPDYDVIYLSLHGVVDEEKGLRTGIIFDNREEQFVLDDNDLIELELKSDLIVMSACHSANGKNFKGEGLKGMTRSFFASGAKNVLSSLWTAGETASMQILPNFLQNYTDNYPKDISLNKSKLDYIESNPPMLSHPYYWANFVIYSGFEGMHSPYRYLYMALMIFGLLLLIYLIFLWKKRRRIF